MRFLIAMFLLLPIVSECRAQQVELRSGQMRSYDVNIKGPGRILEVLASPDGTKLVTLGSIALTCLNTNTGERSDLSAISTKLLAFVDEDRFLTATKAPGQPNTEICLRSFDSLIASASIGEDRSVQWRILLEHFSLIGSTVENGLLVLVGRDTESSDDTLISYSLDLNSESKVKLVRRVLR